MGAEKMSGYLKKIIIVAVAVLFLLVLSGCDNLKDDVDTNYSYLSISANNEYGVETIDPKLSRYRYEEGTIVDINLVVAEGFDFLGWQGSNGDDIVRTGSGQYQIMIIGDKSIEAAFELDEFMFLSLKLGNKDPINKDELVGSESHRIDHDTNEITLRFNNDLGTSADALKIYFESQADEDNEDEDTNEGLIDSRNISIEDNIITIEISDSFYEQELGFGEEYLIKGDRTDGSIRVSDIEGKSTRIESFEVATETVQPESPFLSIEKISESEIELFWTPSKDNKVGYGDTYVSRYNIYRSTDPDNFADQPYSQVGESKVEFPDSLENDKIYYYKVTAVLDKNEYELHWDDGNQESEASNIVDTDF